MVLVKHAGQYRHEGVPCQARPDERARAVRPQRTVCEPGPSPRAGRLRPETGRSPHFVSRLRRSDLLRCLAPQTDRCGILREDRRFQAFHLRRGPGRRLTSGEVGLGGSAHRGHPVSLAGQHGTKGHGTAEQAQEKTARSLLLGTERIPPTDAAQQGDPVYAGRPEVARRHRTRASPFPRDHKGLT